MKIHFIFHARVCYIDSWVYYFINQVSFKAHFRYFVECVCVRESLWVKFHFSRVRLIYEFEIFIGCVDFIIKYTFIRVWYYFVELVSMNNTIMCIDNLIQFRQIGFLTHIVHLHFVSLLALVNNLCNQFKKIKFTNNMPIFFKEYQGNKKKNQAKM